MSRDSSPAWPAGAVLPDYGRGGLFGLIANIAAYLDGEAFAVPGASTEVVSCASDDRILVFLLIDGLGDAFLQRHGQGSALIARRHSRITSVFPSTTASAVTTTLTGLSPARHGLTGWFTFDPRFGGIIAPLPMVVRGGDPIDTLLAARRLFSYASLFQKRARRSVIVTPSHLADSRFSRRHGRGAVTMSFRGLDNMVEVIDAASRTLEGTGGLVHAYYPVFDALSHDHGADSAAAQATFWRIDRAFARLCTLFERRNIEIVVTADHGFIDSPPARQIHLEDHPDLGSLLETPLFGERRTVSCNVRPGAESEFEAAATSLLAGRAVVHRSQDLIECRLFGPGRGHRRLRERLGSHVLLMEEGWTLIDTLAGEKPHHMLGVHGGLSAHEMWIPLIHAGFGERGG